MGKVILDTYTVQDETGEILKRETQVRETKPGGESEPPYIKLYLENLLQITGLNYKLSPILLALVQGMSFITSDPEEGNLIFATKATKMLISKKTGYTIGTINNAISEFKKVGILQSVARGCYRVNPRYFATGNWRNIVRVRAVFDYSADGVEVVSTEATFKED